MRIIITISLLLSSLISFSQTVTVKMKNGDRKDLQIKANTSTQLITDQGYITYSDIDSLTFHGYIPAYDGIKNKLIDAGVKISIGDQIVSPIVLTTNDKQVILVDSIEKFRKQRQFGKGLQLLSLAGFAGALAVQAQYNKDNVKRAMQMKEQKYLSPTVYYAVGGLAVIGFIIDIDAGRHLRMKR